MQGVDKLQKLNTIVLCLAIVLAIWFHEMLKKVEGIHEILNTIITIVGSWLSYAIIIQIIYYLIKHSKFFLKLYWGELYLNGFWYYEYTIQNNSASGMHRGIFEIKQDLKATSIVGHGYTNDMNYIRTELRSVTDLVFNNQLYQIIYVKTETRNPGIEFYAKSSIAFFDTTKYIFNRHPVKFNAQTTICGGTHSGEIHNSNSFKVEEASSQKDVINFLKNKGVKND